MTQRRGLYDAAAWLLRSREAVTVPCPRCGAVAGALCATPMGNPATPHPERATRAAAVARERAQLARWEKGLPPR